MNAPRVGSITTTTGTALNVANTTIGANSLEFKSITAGTAASGPANGIVLTTTGGGGLKVKGDGGGSNKGSGGTIQKTTGSGIVINGSTNISLEYMNITEPGADGITVNNINGLNFRGLLCSLWLMLFTTENTEQHSRNQKREQ